jgi:hypothetical protein
MHDVVPPQEQIPIVHVCPLPVHAPHVAPMVPHEVVLCEAYGTHVPVESQQPFGQDVASQTHPEDDLLHSLPDAHAPHVAPAVPHDWLV